MPATTTSRSRANRAGPVYLERYLELCTVFPLAPIRSKAELRRAEAVLDQLAVMNDDRITPAEADYRAVLTDLYEAAEARLFSEELADLNRKLDSISGLDSLKYLLDQNDMTASDLGRLLGNRQLGSAVLRGNRQLSKQHIRILAAHFRVSADLFLAE